MTQGDKPWKVAVPLDFLSSKATPLSEEAKHVLLILECFARNKAYCWPGNGRIADLAGKQERALRVLYAELERGDNPWIKRVRSTDGKVKRDGFILRRRVAPGLPCVATEEELARAETDMRAELKARRTGKNFPESAGKILPQNKAAAAQQQAAAEAHPSRPADAGSGWAEKKDPAPHPLLATVRAQVRRYLSEYKPGGETSKAEEDIGQWLEVDAEDLASPDDRRAFVTWGKEELRRLLGRSVQLHKG